MKQLPCLLGTHTALTGQIKEPGLVSRAAKPLHREEKEKRNEEESRREKSGKEADGP